MPKLILYPGSKDQGEFDLGGRTVVGLGRAAHNEIIVRRRMASRDHARIEASEGRYFVVDLDSYHGTSVNNRPVRRAELQHGDEIVIANRILRFVDGNGDDPRSLNAIEETLRLPTAPRSAEDTPTLPDFPPPLPLPPSPSPVFAGPLGQGANATAIPARAAGEVLTGEEHDMLDVLRDADLDSASADPVGAVAPAKPVPLSGVPAGPGTKLTPAAPRAVTTARPTGAAGYKRPRWRSASVIVVALLAAGSIWLARYRNQANATGAPTADARALEEALAEGGDARIARLWSFLRSFPTSHLRVRAYQELLAAGVPTSAVCDDARERAPELLQVAPLSEECSR